VQQVRACARRLDLLVGVDGLASYVTAFGRVCRTPVYTGRRGRPRLVLAARFLLAPRQLSRARTRRERAEVAGAHTRDGGRAHRSPLDSAFRYSLHQLLFPASDWGRVHGLPWLLSFSWDATRFYRAYHISLVAPMDSPLQKPP
jgi:hypothetical protein